MIESIRNVGEFEGVKVQWHLCGCALTRALLWPVRVPIKHRVLSSTPDNPKPMLSEQL